MKGNTLCTKFCYILKAAVLVVILIYVVIPYSEIRSYLLRLVLSQLNLLCCTYYYVTYYDVTLPRNLLWYYKDLSCLCVTYCITCCGIMVCYPSQKFLLYS